MLQESIEFRRNEMLPGLEVLDVRDSCRTWTVIHTHYSLGVPTTWQAQVVSNRQSDVVVPGSAFCSAPGDSHVVPRVQQAGSFRVLFFEPDAFASYAEEHGLTARDLAWKARFARPSPELASRIANVTTLVATSTQDALHAQARASELFEGLVGELLECSTRPQPALGRKAGERIRELLHSEDGRTLSLEALGARVGLSRFQALRAFRERYGMPPHTYRIAYNLERSKNKLLRGSPISLVAQEAGFADQSHFNRHFKRIYGVTPAGYVRGEGIRARRTHFSVKT